jgi:hypothetical protein
VAEEDALRKLLSSGEEDEEEGEEKEDGGKDSEGEEKCGKPDTEKASGGQNSKEKDSAKEGPGGSAGSGSTAGSSSKKKKSDLPSGAANSGGAKKAGKKENPRGSSGDFSSDITDSGDGKKKQPKDVKNMKEPNRGASSRSGTPTKDGLEGGKRKLSVTPEPGASHTAPHSKRARLNNFSSAALSPYYNLTALANFVNVRSIKIITTTRFVCVQRVSQGERTPTIL